MKNNLSIYYLVAITSFLIITSIIALRKKKKFSYTKDYVLSSPNDTFGIAAFILISLIGGNSTIGIINKIYSSGLIVIISTFFFSFSWLILAAIITPRIYKFKGCISIGDMMELLYGRTARWITSPLSIIFTIGITTLQIYIVSKILAYCFQISITKAQIIATGLTFVHTFVNGTKTISQLSKFFLLIFISSITIISVFGMYKVIESGSINNLLKSDFLEINLEHDNVLLFLNTMIFLTLPSFSPVFIQRCLSITDGPKLKKTLYTVFSLHCFIWLIFCVLAIIMKTTLNGNSSSNTIFIKFIIENFPELIASFAIIGLLVIILSGASSWLNTASVLFTHDVLRILIPIKDREHELNIARFISFIFAVSCFFFASFFNNFNAIFLFINHFWKPIIFVPLAVGLLGLNVNKSDFMVSLIFAIIFAIAAIIYNDGFTVFSILTGMLGSVLGFIFSYYYNYQNKVLKIKIITLLSQKKKLFDNLKSFKEQKRMTIVKNLWKENLLNQNTLFRCRYIIALFGVVNCFVPAFTIYNKISQYNNNITQHLYLIIGLLSLLSPIIYHLKQNRLTYLYLAITSYMVFILLPVYKLLIYSANNLSITYLIINFIIFSMMIANRSLNFISVILVSLLSSLLFYYFGGVKTTLLVNEDIINKNTLHFVGVVISFILLVVVILIKEMDNQIIIEKIQMDSKETANIVISKINTILNISAKLTEITNEMKIIEEKLDKNEQRNINKIEAIDEIKKKRHVFISKTIQNITTQLTKKENQQMITIKMSYKNYRELTKNISNQILTSSMYTIHFIREILDKLRAK